MGMKKVISMMLMLLMSFNLSACGSSSGSATEVPAAEETDTVSSSLEESQPATESDTETPTEEEEEVIPLDPEVASFHPGYVFTETAGTKKLKSKNVISTEAVLIDVDSGEIIAGRKSQKVIPPASMTKILTLLVASEHLNAKQLKKTYKFRQEIFEYPYAHGCSVAGFVKGEKVPVRDLLYGTILPSGADAAVALADVVAGGHDEFVELMNEKVEELGLSETAHFTNCVGIYDDDLHCTVEDMAVILKAALENTLARKVLHAHTYTTTKNKKHPDGIFLSNLFLRRIEDKNPPGEVAGAKTGFVNQSGNCAASYLIANNGGHYICVTAHSMGSWRCIMDHVEIYQKYVK